MPTTTNHLTLDALEQAHHGIRTEAVATWLIYPPNVFETLERVDRSLQSLDAVFEAESEDWSYSEYPRPPWWKRLLRIRSKMPNYLGMPIYWSRNMERT